MYEGESGGAARIGRRLIAGLAALRPLRQGTQVVYGGTSGCVAPYVCRGDRGDRECSRCLTVGSLRLDPSRTETSPGYEAGNRSFLERVLRRKLLNS
jgi:hypothetical protein